MPPSSAKRIAAIAVFRYGVDRARVQQEVQTILRGKGGASELLGILVGNGLLTTIQADELRRIMKGGMASPVALPRLKSSKDETPPPSGSALTDPGTERRSGSTMPVPRSLGGFRILRWLGEGGMGAVYLGYHEEQRRQVAVKVLAEELAVNPVCIECFHRESKSSTLLEHPCLVRGISAGRDEASGLHYLVREFVDGPSGHVLLDRMGRLPVGDAVHIVLDVARALEYLHGRNFVHRDIKPDNILLDRSGTAKLADLGLVKRIGETMSGTKVHHGFGTSHYMPYEQAADAGSVDGRSDIYALGATLYHFLTGQVPFAGENHLEIVQKKDVGAFVPARMFNPEVPIALDGILTKMLARRPCDRYQTAAQLVADLVRSGLVPLVPSFADLEWTPSSSCTEGDNQPTALDRNSPLPSNSRSAVWYLRYQDPSGRWCKTKATTKQLMRRLHTGRMPISVKACLQPRGQFRPLTAYPLFRETAILPRLPEAAQRKTALAPPTLPAVPALPSPLTRACGSRWLLVLRLGLAGGCLAAVGLAVYRLVLAS